MADSARQYLQTVLRSVEAYGGRFAETPTVEVLTPEDTKALVEAIATFPDGSRLAVSVLVDTSGSTPVWRKYRFHYMDASNECLFRYDNAPHHRHVATFR